MSFKNVASCKNKMKEVIFLRHLAIHSVKNEIYKAIPHKDFKNTGLVSSGASLTSWGEGASLAF